LAPIVDKMRCKPDREANSKADEKTCPEHHVTPVQNSQSWCLRWRALRGDLQLRLRVVRQRRAGRLAHRGEALFHEAKGPASFHSIKGMDNLILIEDRDEPVQCARGVM
jgi:hypothetical protein